MNTYDTVFLLNVQRPGQPRMRADKSWLIATVLDGLISHVFYSSENIVKTLIFVFLNVIFDNS